MMCVLGIQYGMPKLHKVSSNWQYSIHISLNATLNADVASTMLTIENDMTVDLRSHTIFRNIATFLDVSIANMDNRKYRS